MIQVRQAKQEEWELILDFQLRMARETEHINLDKKVLEAGVKAVFQNPEKACYYVAEVDGEVQASLMITYEWSDWRNRTIWWIQSVYVAPEFRRRGVYATMYKYIQALVVNDPNVGGIRLYVDRNNLSAQSTYNSLGMDGDHYRMFEWMKTF